MPDNNLPGDPGPVDDAGSIETAAEGIADLLEDPETDLPEGSEDATAGPDDQDDPDIDVSEDVEDEEDADDPDGSDPEIKGGRFAPDSAKVTLEDGSVITVAELKRNNLFQRDYTGKTQALSEERKQFDERKSAVDQQAQSLAQLAERLTAFGQRYLPTPPDPPTDPNDYVGWHNYRMQKDAFDEAISSFNGIVVEQNRLTQGQQFEQQDQDRQAWANEAARLVEQDQFFSDPKKVQAFFDDAVSMGDAWGGLTAEEIGGLRTHKAFLVLRDAVRYRKALAKSAGVQKQVQAKPVVQPGGRRADPKARQSAARQARSEQLRKSGTIDDAAASIADLL